MADHSTNLDEIMVAALKALALDGTVPARDRVAAARELREWLGDRPGAGDPGPLGDQSDPGVMTLEDIDKALRT